MNTLAVHTPYTVPVAMMDALQAYKRFGTLDPQELAALKG